MVKTYSPDTLAAGALLALVSRGFGSDVSAVTASFSKAGVSTDAATQAAPLISPKND